MGCIPPRCPPFCVDKWIGNQHDEARYAGLVKEAQPPMYDPYVVHALQNSRVVSEVKVLL